MYKSTCLYIGSICSQKDFNLVVHEDEMNTYWEQKYSMYDE